MVRRFYQVDMMKIRMGLMKIFYECSILDALMVSVYL